MSMSSSTSQVASWFADLPLSDPRCKNDSCIAYHKAHVASQAQISWASQFLYGHYVAWFYAIILAFFIAAFWYNQLRDRFIQRPSTSPPRWCSRSIALVRSFTYRRFRGKIAEYLRLPSFGVLFLIVFFFFSATLMVFAQHPYYRPRRGFGSPPLAVRAGLMAFALIPLEIALAGKYNLITLLTGIGHEKLNAFHRWVGYIMLFLSIIHTVPFIWQPRHEGGSAALHAQYYKKGGYEFTGTPPFGMLVGLALLSVPPLRRKMYEFFVNFHILLSITFFGLCFWHAGQELDSWAYLWATLALWLVSYLGRMFAKSSSFRLEGPWLSGCPTFLYPLADDMVKLEVYLPPGQCWNWEPGQHVFLRFPIGLMALDNHPFTIANACHPCLIGNWNSKEKYANYVHVIQGGQIMKFLVRPQKGLTARLGTMSKSQTMTGMHNYISTIVEGPYGTIIRPGIERRYDNMILVAGGGGISAVLPWMEHIAQLLASKESFDKCITKKVYLLWIVRGLSALEWAQQELKDIKTLHDQGFYIHIWVTGQKDHHQHDSSQTDNSENSSPELDFIDQITFQQRPNMAEFMSGKVGPDRTIVIGCGPESLKINLSNAVAQSQFRVMKGLAVELKLHTDTFGW